MKNKALQFKPRSAGHRALFDRSQPFQTKVEQRRDRYQRRYKTRQQQKNQWDCEPF